MEPKAKILNRIIDIVLGHNSGPIDYPPRLFKYRQANERNINAFRAGEAWFQTPKGWSDPKDCRVFYDEKACVEELMKRRVELRIDLCKRALGTNSFRHMLEKPGGKRDWTIVCDVMDNAVNEDGTIERRLLFKQLVKHFGKGQAINMTGEVMKAADEALSSKKMKPLKENLEKLVKAINVRDRYNFLCLTERCDNDKMWDEYAKGGFCIE